MEKVQREDSPPEEEEAPQKKKSPPGKTIIEKRNLILFDSAVLGLVVYVSYYNAKFFLKTFDFGLSVVKDILKNLLH